MINALNVETAHHYGDTYPKLLKRRYDEFVVRQKYGVPSFNGMEYDQYDTPGAVYFTWHDDKGLIQAGMRILPTHRPYMIKELWPQIVEYIGLPESPTIWEATRFFIDRNMDQSLRHQAHGEILCALLEFAISYGVTNYIAVAPPKLWDYTFRRCGWPAEAVGPVTDIGFSENVEACIMTASQPILDSVRATMGIHVPVLSKAAMLRDKDVLVDQEVLRKLGPYPYRVASALCARPPSL